MVDLIATDEQQQITASVADFLSAEMPLARLTSRRDDPDADYRLFPRMAALGWFGLGLPEADGGLGLSAIEEASLFRELGRVLAPPAVLATCLAAELAAREGQADLAAQFIAGQAIAALTLPAGPRRLVLEGRAATHLLFLSEDQCSLVETGAAGPLTPGRSADDALALDTLEGVPTGSGVSGDAAARIWSRAKLLSAAMLAGVCEAARDAASEYAKVRKQFDQPIGVFQAVKHKCSDMAIRAEAVNAQLAFASICLRDARPDTAFQVNAAKLLAGQYALLSAKEAIQVHGAIGFTTELPLHLLLKRAHVLDQCLGGTRGAQVALLDEPAPQVGSR